MVDDDPKDSDSEHVSSDNARHTSRPIAEDDEGHLLELRRVGNSVRHYVAGRPVNTGDLLEVKLPRGWIRGTYEWRFISGTPPGLRTPQGVLALESAMRVRFPPS
jgi:hypothetical protein